MAMNFDHVTLGQRVRFGSGRAARNLAAEVQRLHASNVMVIAGERELPLAEQVAAEITVAVWHTDVVMHVPIETAGTARRVAAENNVDLLVSVGGGSTTGLAKAIALTSGIPIVAVPTTYAGSEATNVWGLTEAARKTTGIDDRVLPETVIYDSGLTLSLPVEMSVASGLNGMAHCVDSLWAPKANPINAALAAEGIRALRQGLPKIVTDPQGIDGRDQALYGAYLSAVSFASAGSGLHHKICHVLGGTFNLPHAETHAVVLRYVAALNLPAVPETAGGLAQALGGTDAITELNQLYQEVGAPGSLAELGMPEEGITEAVDRVLAAVPAGNPVTVNTANATALLTAALNGDDPATLN